MPTALAVASFICAALLTILLPSHLRGQNVAIITTIGWLLMSNVIHGVNTMIWDGNVSVVVPIWCDIATPILLGLNVALPSASLCLCRRLRRLASGCNAKDAGFDHARQTFFDVSFCIGLPIVYLAFHLIVQDRRFVIIEDFGCEAAVHPSLVGLVVIYAIPLILSAATLAYAGSTAICLYRRRYSFSSDTKGGVPTAIIYYIRLLGASAMQAFVLLSLFVFNAVARASEGTTIYTSWNAVHAHMSTIQTFTTSELSNSAVTRIAFTWWTVPSLSLLAFALFGFGDVVERYQTFQSWVRNRQSDEARFRQQVVLPLHMNAGSSATLAPTTSRWSMDDDEPPLRIHTRSVSLNRTVSTTSTSKPTRPRITIDPHPPMPVISPEVSLSLSPVSSTEDDAADVSFAQSTLTYLESPTARQALSRAPSLSRSTSPFVVTATQPPPAVPMPKSALKKPRSQRSLRGVEGPVTTQGLAPESAAGDRDSVAGSSILSPDAWPQPPRTIPLAAFPSHNASATSLHRQADASVSAPSSRTNRRTDDALEPHISRSPPPFSSYAPAAVPPSPMVTIPRRSRSGTVGRLV